MLINKQTDTLHIHNFKVDALGNPKIRRNVLQTHHGILSQEDDNPFQPFEFEDNNNERWELNEDPPPAVANPIDLAPIDETSNKTPFQIDLMDLLQRHKTDLKVYDEIIKLMSSYLKSGKIRHDCSDLITRKQFINKVEKTFQGRHNPEWTALHTKRETSVTFSVVRLVSSCTPRTQPQYIFNANVNTFSRSIGADDYEDVFK